MKIGIITDIHSNIQALNAVLNEFDKIVHYPINEVGEYKKHIRKAGLKECRQLFVDVNANIYIYGHMHIANINNEKDEWYINPGSLGCPMLSNVTNCGILNI